MDRGQAGAWVAPVFVLLWSTGFIGAKFGLPHAEPMTFLALRFLIVAALLLPVALILGEMRGAPHDWRSAAVIGALLHGAYLGGVFAAIWLGIGAGFSALIVGLQPIVTALFAGAVLGERMTRRMWTGCALGFAGAALTASGKLAGGEASALGIGLCVLALLAISGGSVLQKRRDGEPRIVRDMGVQFLSAGLCCLTLALFLETREIEWAPAFVGVLLWSILVLSLGAVTLLYLLIRRGTVNQTARLFFLVPGVTALMAWALFGETFGPVEAGGLALASFGVWWAGQPDKASA